jgi:O-antigen ligase
MKILETKSLFLVFPIFMYLSKDFIKKDTLNKTLIVFVISNLVLLIWVWVHIFLKGFSVMLLNDTYYNPVFRSTFASITKIHLPYLGLLNAFSCLISIHYLYQNKNVKLKGLFFLAIIFSITSMVFFSARMAIGALIVCSIFFVYKKSKKRLFIVFSILAFLTVLATTLSPLERRIKEFSKVKFVLPKNNTQSHKVNFRYIIYNCSLEIFNESWLKGLGLGNVQKRLNTCYEKVSYTNYDDFTKKTYNTHNQYLNEFLTYGIFGFIIFMSFIIYLFIKSNGLYRVFLLLVFLCLITENIFEREIGVIFFTLINTLFYISSNKKFNNNI